MPRSFAVASSRQFQGQILLERALFCVGCEVIFSGSSLCPRCGGETVWPLAEWLQSARLSPAPSALRFSAAADAPAPHGEQTRPAAQGLSMVVELIDRCEANGPELERGKDLERYAARVRAAPAN